MSWQDQPCVLGNSRQSLRIWKRLYGDPGSLYVLHRCNEAVCREPTHLYLGTQSQNTKDAIDAGHFVPPMSNLEVRAKVSATKKGRVMSPEHRAAISKARRGQSGVPHTDEAKRKISESMKAYRASGRTV